MLQKAVILTIAAAMLSWPLPPAPPAVIPTVNVYAGNKVVDPYGYFENLKKPAVERYFREQADYTNAVLAKLGPQRDKIRADVARLAAAQTAVFAVNLIGNRLFYLARPPSANNARLMVSENGSSRILLDPDVLAKQTGSKAHLSLSQVLPSPDGKRVAVGIVPGGAEAQTHTRIVDVASATLLPEDFPRTWGGLTAWTADSTTVFYQQLPKLRPGQPQTDLELRSMVYRHVLGASGPDKAIMGIGLDPKVPFVPIDAPVVTISPVSDYALGLNTHGVQNELTIYVAPVAQLTGAGPIAWRKIADVGDDVTGFDLKGPMLYLLTHKDAPHFKITAIDLSKPEQTASSATTIVPTGKTVIQQVAVAHDGLYVRGIDGGIAVLSKLPWNADGSPGTSVEVPLPFKGTLQEFSTDPRVDGAALGLVSWIKPLLVYTLDPGGALADTRIVTPPNIDTSPYVAMETESKSADGTMVPLSIVMKRGTRLDGTNPAYLEAYGAYGLDIDPAFLGRKLAWIDAGGIWAVSHVRGGGENGQDWYEAGKGPTKQHTIDDAIGAARYLIANKYTSASHLGIEGTSAGGIMVGGAITQHPELFAAALDVVGDTDDLRSVDADPNGATNIPEFGTPKTKAGFPLVYAIDAYQHIKDGTAYPAVMAVTGINDPRVAPWQAAKFAARLQRATTSGRPVLLRVDYDAGHGMLAASQAQQNALFTDEFSFLLWQCASPLFAGYPTRIAAR